MNVFFYRKTRMTKLMGAHNLINISVAAAAAALDENPIQCNYRRNQQFQSIGT